MTYWRATPCLRGPHTRRFGMEGDNELLYNRPERARPARELPTEGWRACEGSVRAEGVGDREGTPGHASGAGHWLAPLGTDM